MRRPRRLRSVVAPPLRHALVNVSLLVACGGAADPSGSIATQPVHHMETELARAGADLEPSAIAYVRERIAELVPGISADDDFEVVSGTVGAGLRHVRLQQTHRGVPVHGSIVIAHADDATFLGLNGYLTRELDGFDVASAVTGDDAVALAKADHGAAPEAYSDEARELVILPGPGGAGATLAWRVTFQNARAGAIRPGRWRYFIDARDGTVLRKTDRLQTAVLQASGPGRVRSWDAELDVEEDGGELVMETDRLKTVDAGDDDEVIKGTDLGHMPDGAANDAHGYAEITLAMMRDWMGRDSLDDDGYDIESRVHEDDVCGNGPSNACWDGETVSYGIGGDGIYDWSGALDIVAHEMNHGFTEFHSELDYEGESGGLNESFSDVAGAIAEFYDEGDDADFDVAEDIMMAGGGALRFMCDPTIDGASVGDVRDLYDDIDVHNSSGVGNRAFCLAVGRTKAAEGSSTSYAVQRMGSVWYAANAAYWTSGTDYAEACRGTIDAARALGFTSDVVEGLAHSWSDVGVSCPTSTTVCDQDGECDVGGGETCAGCPDDCGACGEDCTSWQLGLCGSGVGDCGTCGGGDRCGDRVCAGDESDESCPADCGCAALDCGDLAPFGCYCDDTCDDYGDCCADRGDACG